MITSSSDNKLRKQVLDFVSPRANIHHSLNDGFSFIAYLDEDKIIGGALEIIDQDNDFYYLAFEDSNDFRRYWKDFNFHFFYKKKFQNFWGSLNLMYSRSLNYQWELEINPSLPYYHPGRDVDNFFIDLKITYPIKF